MSKFNLLFAPSMLAVGAFLISQAAEAQSLTGNVGSAGISDGEQSIETRFGINDDGDAGARVHYDYAATGWYQLRLISSFSRPDDEDWDFSAFTVENWFQWSEEARSGEGFNGGLRFAYGFADGGGPDEAEVRLTITDKFAGDWEWRANAIGEVETGSGSEGGVEIETRAQLTRGVDTSLLGAAGARFGVEVFSEWGNSRDIGGLDEQAHQIGPVLKLDWSNGVFLQSAIRAGLTDASDDAMFKVFIGREF
ncbi:hypothetical protein [Henriciella algicola]|uniref:Copper resistance protein B n=1 Tax=Henriciella algicola TaxID=1608422 RepID=A0A399RKX7_9PROT|nr:hypothetical protein [Henriciella algicola]RIJ31341.1 hypothetical protein D1222_03520 [Henriciella algicola]